jgi:hypothetical protein
MQIMISGTELEKKNFVYLLRKQLYKEALINEVVIRSLSLDISKPDFLVIDLLVHGVSEKLLREVVDAKP